MPTIDGPAVVADLKRLAEFGRYRPASTGATYSPVDVESRHCLAEKFCEAGLATVITDRPVIGASQPRAAVGRLAQRNPALGGWLDAPWASSMGWKLARAFFRRSGSRIDVAAWADEKAITAIISAALVYRCASRRRDRLRPAAAMNEPVCREALDAPGLPDGARAVRSVALRRLSRGTYRARGRQRSMRPGLASRPFATTSSASGIPGRADRLT